MDCRYIIDNYLKHIHNNFVVYSGENECSIVTPFLDPSGDHIEIRLIVQNGKILLTDEGSAYDYLFENGIDVFGKSELRKYHFDTALNNNGAFLYEGNQIAVEVGFNEDIGLALNRLIRAVNSIQYLIYTIKEPGIRTFKEEVAAVFTSRQIAYTSDFSIQGYAKNHRFDFYIAKKKPVVIKALSTESIPYTKRLATDTAFSIIDIEKTGYLFFPISLIDDTKDVWVGEAVEILEKYSKLIRWTNQNVLFEYIT